MNMKTCFLFIFLIYIIDAKPYNLYNQKKCGYQSCHQVYKNKLNVHLIPHSHDDLGWLKTVDEYYYGTNNFIQKAGVQYIIGSTIDALTTHPDRRYIQVEIGFFWRWWKDQEDYVKELIKHLITEGRLEIANGGWSMNDEAVTHYQSIIDQFTWGLRIINDTLGPCGRPKIGWQIDPFGHSRQMAAIYSELGYEGMFFWRLDYRDDRKRKNEKNLEFMWQGSPNTGSNIFTSILNGFYATPPNFCFDVLCGNGPLIDDQESSDNNLLMWVNLFNDHVSKVAKHYKTNNVLITMGGDFHFQAANMIYTNLDKLILGFKKYSPDVNVIYSTPACYLKAVNDATQKHNASLLVKTGDFMPHASDAHSYWTGYYTSRPNSKRLERQGNNLLQVLKQLAILEGAFVNINDNRNGKCKFYSCSNLTPLKDIIGIMQHHDAITGTEKQRVANDYVKRIYKAIKASEKFIGDTIINLSKKNLTSSRYKLNVSTCLMTNVSICDIQSANNFIIIVYNPLSREVDTFVRLPVTEKAFKIIDFQNKSIEYAVTQSFLELGNLSSAPNELVFQAKNLPPMGFKIYHVQIVTMRSNNTKPASTPRQRFIQLGFKNIEIELDGSTGLLHSITLNGIKQLVRQELLYYHSSDGYSSRASGAYTFKPSNLTLEAIPVGDVVRFNVTKGSLCHEVRQYFNNWVKQIIRLCQGETYVEFDWVVGPIDVKHKLGVEVITRYITSLETNGIFYTDSNGREMIKRIRNYRETYTYTNEEPISGNYYPVTTKIVIKDAKRNLEFAVLTDRPEGGTSLEDGQIELMVHRRILTDDGLGVEEPLNELEFNKGVIVRGKHYITCGYTETDRNEAHASRNQHDIAQRKHLEPWIWVDHCIEPYCSQKQLQDAIYFEFRGLKRNLPNNVNILTLEPWARDNILIRLEHVFENNEHKELSQVVTVDLNDLFTRFTITLLRETTLGANQWLEENEKLKWNYPNSDDMRKSLIQEFGENIIPEPINLKKNTFSGNGTLNSLIINLKPMQIRTFIATIISKV